MTSAAPLASPPLPAERLERLIRRHRRHSAQDHLPGVDRDDEEGLALSPAQERIWAQSTGPPRAAGFHQLHALPIAIRVRGPLKASMLKRTLHEIQRRHESLRTTFTTIAGVVRPVIHDALEVPLPLSPPSTPSTGPDHPDPLDRWRRAMQNRGFPGSQRPFDLPEGPLLRGRIVQLAKEDHLLLLVAHRLIMDDWSTGILLREMQHLYALGPGKRRKGLPDLPAQYVDFAAWQRRWLAGDQAAEQRDYWRTQVADLPPLALPANPIRPGGYSPLGATIGQAVPLAITGSLRYLARQEQATLYMTLLAALQSLLAATTGQAVFGIGTAVPGRAHPDTRQMIGAFASTIVVRADLTGDPTFRATLDRARRTALDAFRHQELPFARVEATLAQTRDLRRDPLFSVVLTMNSDPAAETPADGPVSFERLTLASEPAPVGLTFTVTERDQELWVALTYAIELFAPDAMTTLLERFIQVLATMAANPDLRLSALPAATGWPASRGADHPVTIGPGLAVPAAPGESIEAPRTPTEATVAEVWRQVLELEQIGRDEDFFDLGGHSLLLALVAAGLHAALGLEIPPALFFSAPTIARLAAEIDALRQPVATAPTTMIALQPAGDRRPIFFVPGGIGDGSRLFRFAKLAREIGQDRPFYGFYADDVEESADPGQWVEATAADYVRQLREVQPDGPYLLFGACLGGLIVQEMGRQLLEAGQDVPRLILIDTRHPGMPATRASRQERQARHQERRTRRRGGATEQSASAMAAILDDLEFESGVVALQSPRVRHLKQFRPARYPGSITLFANQEWFTQSPTLGWAADMVGSLDVRPLPGQHGSFQRDHTEDLAAILRDLIAEIETEAGGAP